MNPKKISIIKTVVKSLFKTTDKKPFELTDGEAKIFLSVIDPKISWLWISAPTRYGKTETVALALIYLAVKKKLKIPVVAGSIEKANKIMEYIVSHLGDHPMFYEGLINLDFRDIDRLKVQMSKSALRWKDGGWIYVTSVESRSISKEGEGVVGEGGDLVMLEEAGLIKHKEQFSKIVRMPESARGWGKLVMAGNCIEQSVFEDAFNDPLYKKVKISLDQATKEGRYTEKELEEKKGQTTSKDWKRYYLVQFPKQGEFTYFKPKKYEYLPNDLQFYGAVDLALGESLKGSKVGIVILGRNPKDGQVYEVESLGEHIKPDETMRRIFNFVYTFERFGVEDVAFQRYFLNIIKEKSQVEKKYIPFEGIKQRKNKAERVESIEPAINTGQILFKGDNELWEEMMSYPQIDNYDTLDALEMVWRLVSQGATQFAFV